MFTKILKTTYYLSIISVIAAVALFYFQTKQIVSASEFSSDNIKSFVEEFYTWAIQISGGLSILVLIFAGYLYVTSAGNTEQNTKAKDLIIGVLMGLVFLILAGMFFNTLKSTPSGNTGGIPSGSSSSPISSVGMPPPPTEPVGMPPLPPEPIDIPPP